MVRVKRGSLLLLSLAACNELYGLDETELRPPTPVAADGDGDGVPDVTDGCPGAADPDQRDRDGDGFGDACDFCPDLATAVNHDEDLDAYGDACDRCPARPDFQVDSDADGVGDLCDDDAASQNAQLRFDPFLGIEDGWQQAGAWSALGDAITSEPGASLAWPAAVIDGTRSYAIDLGVTVPQQLAPGDRFGVELVDGDIVRASCLVSCQPVSGVCLLELSPATSATAPVTLEPVTSMVVRKNGFRLACTFSGAVATDDQATTPPTFPRATVRLVGSPKVQFRYANIRQ